MDIRDISGVGEVVAKALEERGLGQLRDLARASLDELEAVPGIGPVNAKRIRKAAKKLITPQVSVGLTPAAPAPEPREPPPPVTQVAVGSSPVAKGAKKARKAEAKARKLESKAAKLQDRAQKLQERAGHLLAKAAKKRTPSG